MKTILSFIGYNIPTIAFLLAALWLSKTDHYIAMWFCLFTATCTATTPKTED